MLKIDYSKLHYFYLALATVSVFCWVFNVSDETLGILLFWLAVLALLVTGRFATSWQNKYGEMFFYLAMVISAVTLLITVAASLQVTVGKW